MKKKLGLKKVTLRDLDTTALERVAGGFLETDTPSDCICLSDPCEPTWYNCMSNDPACEESVVVCQTGNCFSEDGGCGNSEVICW